MKLFIKSGVLAALCAAGIAQADPISECCLWENMGFQVKGGVVPIIWVDRGNSLCAPNTSVTAVNTGKFLSLFKVPWTVGFEVQWSVNDCDRVYLDFQYRQAKGKNYALAVPVFFTPDNEAFLFGKYKTYSAYIGVDHYFMHECMCENLSAYAGIKVGFTHQNNLNLTVTSVDFATPTVNCFKRRNVLSGGGRFGLEYANVCNCLTISLNVEILGQAGPRLGSLALPNNLLAQPAVLNAVSSEVLFPITLGFGFNF